MPAGRTCQRVPAKSSRVVGGLAGGKEASLMSWVQVQAGFL